MKRFRTLIATVAITVALAFSANATQITGTVILSGGQFTPTGGADLSTATGIDFTTNTFFVSDANGDFTSLAGNVGSIQDFIFSPFVGPINNLYNVSNAVPALAMSFDLASLSIVSQLTNFLNLSGTGTMHLTDFDDTSGVFHFTATTSGAGENALFSWTADTSSAAAVPEPAGLLILGIGLLCLAGFAYRRNGASNFAG